VASRGSHFFSASLVDTQFDTLEPPTAEPGVLALDTRLPLDELTRQVQAWLHERSAA
jgi:gluconokinase